MASKNSPSKLLAQQRKVKVWELKCKGYSQREIAGIIGLCEARVSNILAEQRKALTEQEIANREAALPLELSKLDNQEKRAHRELYKLDHRERELYRVRGHFAHLTIITTDIYVKFQAQLDRICELRRKWTETLDRVAQRRHRLLQLEGPPTQVNVGIVSAGQDPLAGLDLVEIAVAAREARRHDWEERKARVALPERVAAAVEDSA